MRSSAALLTRWYLVLALAPLLCLSLIFYIYDPLAIYHAPWGRQESIGNNIRLQAVGVIRHGDFDSVLLGTSVLENTSADMASTILGGQFVNMSISAGDFYERSVILDYLLRKRKLLNVVYSLDFIYINQKKGYQLYPLSSYEYLYDHNPFNDIRVYLNRHHITCLFKWSSDEECVGRRVTWDRPNAWMEIDEYARRFGGISHWCANVENYQIVDVIKKLSTSVLAKQSASAQVVSDAQVEQTILQAISYVENLLLRYIEDNPRTIFYLVFPAYHRAKFAIWHQTQPENARVHEAVVRYITTRATKLKNLHLHGYEDQSFLDDVRYYKDLDHIQYDFNERMLKDFRLGRHKLDEKNIETYLQEARIRAKSFDLENMLTHLTSCRLLNGS